MSRFNHPNIRYIVIMLIVFAAGVMTGKRNDTVIVKSIVADCQKDGIAVAGGEAYVCYFRSIK